MSSPVNLGPEAPPRSSQAPSKDDIEARRREMVAKLVKMGLNGGGDASKPFAPLFDQETRKIEQLKEDQKEVGKN